jgi:Divergent InlB B-repeat domain
MNSRENSPMSLNHRPSSARRSRTRALRLAGTASVVVGLAVATTAVALTWGTPTDLSAPGSPALYPQVAVARDGAATVVWRLFDGNNTIVQAATRPAGSSTWGPTADLSATGRDATSPEVAIAPDGAATVVWSRSDGSNIIIQTTTRPAGSTTWDAPVDLTATGQNAAYPQVAVAPDGVATVVWHRSDGSSTLIQAATRAAGSGSWGATADVSGPGQSYDPQIAVTPDGVATVVWRDGVNDIIQGAASEATTYPLTVTTAGTGAGTVSSAPAGITCGATCSATFTLSTPVTLTATPASGSTFTGWSGACSGSTTTCTVTVLGATSVTAAFRSNSAPSNASSAPSNTFRVGFVKTPGASILTRVSVPGAGTITQQGTYGAASQARHTAARIACRASRTTAGATTLLLRCPLNAAARAARSTSALRVRIVTSFTPRGGSVRSTSHVVTFRARPPRLAVTG